MMEIFELEQTPRNRRMALTEYAKITIEIIMNSSVPPDEIPIESINEIFDGMNIQNESAD